MKINISKCFSVRLTHLGQLGAGGPLPQGDGVVVVGVAGVQEGGHAVLQGVERSPDGEQLVARHSPEEEGGGEKLSLFLCRRGKSAKENKNRHKNI